MKDHKAIMLALVAFLLLSGLAMAQIGSRGLVPVPAAQAGTSAGGSYQLTSLAWQVSGTAVGGRYTLTVPCAPALRGSGCCCSYLPIVLRSAQ
jgi:hypothetical protein